VRQSGGVDRGGMAGARKATPLSRARARPSGDACAPAGPAERAIHEGPSYNNYNDIPEWRYSSLLHAFGQPPGEGFSAAAQTVGELDAALTRADESRFRHATNLIEVRVAREDLSDALVQFGQFLKAKAGLK